MIDESRFATIQREYNEARAAWHAAEARYRAASKALMSAQCREHFATTPGRAGVAVRHECTLMSGHRGAHGNRTLPPTQGI